jgi:hypothetical protein
LTITVDDNAAENLEQIRTFLEGGESVRFAGKNRAEVYAWVERTLVRHEYMRLKRPEKGLVRRYLSRLSGLSRAQVTRLIGGYQRTGKVQATVYERRKFAVRYTESDVNLLAHVDKAHGNLSGPATKRILEREHTEYGQAAYERIAQISVAQLYRIRGSEGYRKRNTSYEPTRPTVVSIGERRPPKPDSRPGYLRVDTVHQGDRDGVKGIYHINAVDEVTQWEVIAATPYISEAWLIPVLEALLGQFPFVIQGFHSDNGSEYINHAVSKLLGKLLITHTKSRAGHSTDNGLVECKNGAVIRKHIGFGHISSEHAEVVNAFHRDHLNPYVNYHRPCAVPEVHTDASGKSRRIYKKWATPLEQLLLVPDSESYLRPGVERAELLRLAGLQSDTESAIELQRAKRKLTAQISRAGS